MVIKEYRLPGPGIFGQKSAQLATSQHTDKGEQCEIAILQRTLQLSANSWAEDQRDTTSWGSAQVGLSGLIRQASCSVAVQLLVQLSRTVMRSQFVVLIASLGLVRGRIHPDFAPIQYRRR